MKDINTYEVGTSDSGKIIKDYLRSKLQFSRRSIINLKKSGGVTINGSVCHMNTILKENDIVEISFQDSESENILPEQMQLDIIFEDDYLIVLNKKTDMPVHPTRNHIMGTLANGLAYYWLNNDRPIKVRPINRLDKDTSGLVMFAKSAHIQHLLSYYVGREEFKKEYIAIVHGQIREREGTIDLPIAREAEKSMKRVVHEDGDRAVTHFQTMAVSETYSVVNIRLETGRTHQIRVHMSHIGHPLLGDTLYGGNQELISRQALHAERITMLHPFTKKWHIFIASVPEDIQRLIL